MNTEIMFNFLKSLEKRKLLDVLYQELFNLDYVEKINYVTRIIQDNNCVIIDLYDNVSNNKFNRYIFSFNKEIEPYKIEINNNVYIHIISIYNLDNPSDNILKLGYLFSFNDKNKMIKYAKSFLSDELIKILISKIK